MSLLAAVVQAAQPRVEIIAHRGASYDAPENTVAAIKLAWDHQADAAEFDVLQSKDGKIVAIHDTDTKRLAGVPKTVVEQTLAELRRLDVGKWNGAKFSGERIPTLEEMLATVPDGKRVFIEIKTGPEIIPELQRVLAAAKLEPEQTALIAFDTQVIAAVKKVRPDLQAYWIVSLKDKKPPTAEEIIATAKALKADGLDVSATGLDAILARKVKDAGLKLYVWTVNDPVVAQRLIQFGVDGITSDRPEWLRRQLME